MNRAALPMLSLAALASAIGGARAEGTEARAWVSAQGVDRPGCGADATPCRTLQFAHDEIVRPGGVILARGGADVGSLTIRKAISVIADGSPAVMATTGAAITVNAGASDEVLLKGLTIDGGGTGGVGVAVESVGRLAIESATIRGFSDAAGGYGVGVLVEPRDAAAVSIARTTFADNSWVHVLVNPNRTGGTGGDATATLGDVAMTGAAYGVIVETSAPGSSASATVDSVTMTNPGHTGVYSFAYAPDAPAAALVRNVSVTAARVAFAAGGFGKLSIANSAAFASGGFDLFDLAGGVTSYGGNILPKSSAVASAELR